jgi:hypothetical protein
VTDGLGRCAHSYGLGGQEHAGGSVGVLPRTRRRSIHDSRNLSRAPAASLRDRLRRPLTEPVCRQVRQLSGSGEGPGTGPDAARLPETGREMATRTGDEQSSTAAPDQHGQRALTSPRPRTDLNESGCPHWNLQIRRSRARCVPDEADSHGYWQSLADTSACPLTCVRTGPGPCAYILLSSRSRRDRTHCGRWSEWCGSYRFLTARMAATARGNPM